MEFTHPEFSDETLAQGLRTGNPLAESFCSADEDLEQKIASRTSGRIRDLKVETVGDSVILSGRTSTYYLKQLATQIALSEQADLGERCLSLQNQIDVV